MSTIGHRGAIDIPRHATAYSVFFYTHSPSTGSLINADTLPTCVMRYTDGSGQGSLTSGTELTWAVTNITTGVYRLTLDMTTASAPLSMGRVVTIEINATVGGVSQASAIGTYRVGPGTYYGAVVADAGNTTQTFKTNLTESQSNFWKNAMLLFVTGTLKGQIREVFSYDGSTKFVVLSSALSGAVTAGDEFLIINV